VLIICAPSLGVSLWNLGVLCASMLDLGRLLYSENCEQIFQAVFADGEESEPIAFDFCEKNLVLEFK